MKILLTSNDFINTSLENDFLELTGNRTDLKVALIPTAGDPIEWVKLIEGDESYDNYVPKLIGKNNPEESQNYIYFKNKGYEVIVVDLKEAPDIIKEKLQDVDVIFVGGGDINYLLDWAKKAKLNTYLKDLLDQGVVYVGVSAGNGLLMPDIGLTWWKPDMAADHAGFGIVDFIVVPHQNESDKTSNIKNLTERKMYLQSIINFPWKVYLLKDGQAVKVLDGKVEHVGLGVKKSI